MFEWKTSYGVGIQQIDSQHQQLFRIADDLYHAMAAGKGREVLSRTLEQLVRYTAMHFATEELLMQRHNFPGLAAHRREHEALTSEVNDFVHRFESGQTMLTIELMTFLRNWLTHHISASDKAYSPFLIERGVA